MLHDGLGDGLDVHAAMLLRKDRMEHGCNEHT
jgi:hypothetical protein